MQLMQRLGSAVNDKYIDDYVNAIKKYPKSCDNIWFATPYGFPPLEFHQSHASKLKEYSEKFKEAGVTVSLQLSNSIGHGQYMSSKDCTGLVFENSPARPIVGPDGCVSHYCFCWRGEYFKKYLLSEIEYYIEALKPECLWVDDDFRAVNHAPVDFGCFCDDCIANFNEKYNYCFTREKLAHKILHGEISIRENWIEFIRDGMYDLMREISETVHRISPKTVMGLQQGLFGAYTGFGNGFVYDAMKDGTGLIPMSRPGEGAYDDHDPNVFIKKAITLNWQNACLPDYVKRKCPEIENLPFCVYGKSPAGTAFETSYYFANGNTDMTYSMMMAMREPIEWHEQEFRLFENYRKYWDKLSRYNMNSHQAGMQFFVSKETYKKKLNDDGDFFELKNENYDKALILTRDGFPIAYDRDDETVFLLHPDCAYAISDEEVLYLMAKNVVTDGETISILSKRGFDFGVEAKELVPSVAGKCQEKMTKNPINAGMESYIASSFVKGKNERYYLENPKCPIDVLGYYSNILPLEKFTKMNEYPFGIASAIITNPKGGKWAIYGYVPWKGIISYQKREQILRGADFICGNNLVSKLITPFPAVVLPRCDKEGKTVCVSVTNCTIGDSGELKLVIRNPVSEKFSFMSQYDGEGELDFEKQGNDYVIKIKSIKAWSVLTVFVG
ncbi:MAG: hypothetical protein II998_06575 [Clostridia bacterium]|nr:hypothetical protein [Clostridia bacterium]